MKIAHIATHDRPRERLFREGVSSLSDAELLATILGTGSASKGAISLATTLLEQNISKLSNSSPRELCAIEGIGPAKACRILAAFELHRRLRVQASPTRITNPADAAAVCLPLIGHFETEQFLVVYLDVKLQVRGHRIVASGTSAGAQIDAREVFREAILRGAHAILLAHNHPSGDPSPSEEDLAVSESMREAGRTVGVDVIDHLVVTAEGWRSAFPSCEQKGI